MSEHTPQPTSFPVGQTFGLEGVPDGVTVPGYDQPHARTPERDPDYVFRREVLSDFLAWYRDAADEGLLLVGDTATGKTSLVVQVAAYLNLPLNRATGREQMEFSELVGQLVPQPDGTLAFQDGPLTRAVRGGELFLLDEFDYLDPGVAAGLNGVIEGEPLVIPENGGEVIPPAPGFRIIVTGNTAGGGDDSGSYLGTQRQNMALLDRFVVVQMGYPDAETEKQLVQKKVPRIPNEYLERMIEVARQVRGLFSGEQEGPQLPATMSTRVLLRWARLTVQHKGVRQLGKSPIHYALDRAMAYRLDTASREALHELVQRHVDEEAELQG